MMIENVVAVNVKGDILQLFISQQLTETHKVIAAQPINMRAYPSAAGLAIAAHAIPHPILST